MEFSNKFEVEAELDDVWALMTDVERIAPCLPGTQLTEIAGDDYHGIIKVKVGPIGAQYKGVAKFESIDESARKIILTASGRDVKGSGNARATITVALQEGASKNFTEVAVDVDMNISGKVAQFGRGVITDVNAKLMQKFAENLSHMITSSDSDEDPGEAAQPSSDSPEPEVVDLLEVAGAPRFKAGSLLVVGAGVVLLLLILRKLGRKKSSD